MTWVRRRRPGRAPAIADRRRSGARPPASCRRRSRLDLAVAGVDQIEASAGPPRAPPAPRRPACHPRGSASSRGPAAPVDLGVQAAGVLVEAGQQGARAAPLGTGRGSGRRRRRRSAGGTAGVDAAVGADDEGERAGAAGGLASGVVAWAPARGTAARQDSSPASTTRDGFMAPPPRLDRWSRVRGRQQGHRAPPHPGRSAPSGAPTRAR